MDVLIHITDSADHDDQAQIGRSVTLEMMTGQ
jgi:hypothetical protein